MVIRQVTEAERTEENAPLRDNHKVTEQDRTEQKEHCNSCNASSMEYCLRNRCPYYAVKHYTEEDRNYYRRIQRS